MSGVTDQEISDIISCKVSITEEFSKEFGKHMETLEKFWLYEQQIYDRIMF